MLGARKQYNAELDRRNDKACRIIKKWYLDKRGEVYLDRLTKYSTDLRHESKKLFVECEHRERHWIKPPFPFDTIHIWERRENQFVEGDTDFASLSVNWKWMLLIDRKVTQKFCIKEYLTPNFNLYMPDGSEKSYDIPVVDPDTGEKTYQIFYVGEE